MKIINKRNLIILAIIILLIAGGILWVIIGNNSKNNPGFPKTKNNIEALARCLTDKSVVMYGAYWCPHCQAQKKMFGDSFKYINYVECTKEIKKCEEKKIDGYPTWIFKDGKRAKGEVSFSDLAAKSSCNISISPQKQSNTQSYSSKAGMLSVKQVQDKIEKKDKITLLDVRTQDEFKNGHLTNSILLPLDDVAKKAESVLKDKNAEIIVYCLTGGRSKKAVEILLSKGYTNVIDMQGGITAWQDAGYSVQKDQ